MLVNPTAFAGGAGIGAHAYWRINVTAATSAGNYCTIADIQMRASAGGANQCSGGTASADSFYSAGYDASKAFDGVATTNWTSTGAVYPHWIQYAFSSPVSVAEVAIQVASGTYGTVNESPKDFTIEYSDNGASWLVAKTIIAGTFWAFSEQRLYSVP